NERFDHLCVLNSTDLLELTNMAAPKLCSQEFAYLSSDNLTQLNLIAPMHYNSSVTSKYADQRLCLSKRSRNSNRKAIANSYAHNAPKWPIEGVTCRGIT